MKTQPVLLEEKHFSLVAQIQDLLNASPFSETEDIAIMAAVLGSMSLLQKSMSPQAAVQLVLQNFAHGIGQTATATGMDKRELTDLIVEQLGLKAAKDKEDLH